MTDVTRLLLIRHAEPDEDAQGRCYGRLDIGLSAAGRLRAQALAQALDQIPLVAVYSSPSIRALDTAEPIATVHQLTVSVEEGLHEIDFGELEGRSYDDIEAAHPDLYRTWMKTPTRVEFPGGESYRQLRKRALATLETIRVRHRGGLAVIVSHGGVLRAILADCLCMRDEAIFRIDQSYGALSIVDWLDDGPLVRMVNAQPTMIGARGRGVLSRIAYDEAVQV